MREKTIEKIPYLTLPETNPDEEVIYIGRTAWKNIGHERHILLEVYKNQEGCLEVPVVRYAATKEDWGVYHTQKGYWSGEKIDKYLWGEGLCWYDEKLNRNVTWDMLEKENRLYCEKDMERIRRFFCKDTWGWNKWWFYFSRNEDQIKEKRAEKKRKRRMERLRERKKNTPELEEEALLEWADRHLFFKKHFLYYKKHGRYADMCCSACGGTYSGAWKEGVSYESQFERYIQDPREGQTGKCFLCGESGLYKPQGKVRTPQRMKGHVFVINRYLEQGIVLRYVELGKEWQLKEKCGEKRAEMCGAIEMLDGIEIARTYFLPGKKVHTDFHKHDNYRGEDFWDDCNLYGQNNICIGEAEVYPASFQNLEGTFMQYSALKEYAQSRGAFYVKRYLEKYMQHPQIEMLVKLGMSKTVKHMLEYGEDGVVSNYAARRPDKYLGIRKDKVKLLVEEEGDMKMLRVLRKEKGMGQNWTWQQARQLKEIDAGRKDIEAVLRVMSVQKFLNCIEKYAGCSYGTGCHAAEERLEAIAGIYLDYIQMRYANGYNMENTVYQKPRDLMGAHDQMAAEQDEAAVDDRLKYVAEKFPDIRKNYRKLRNRYFYEDDTFSIRPARSAEEIVLEGRKLHHCVGGDSYLERHNNDKSYILMLRFKEMEEIPYITVEMDLI